MYAFISYMYMDYNVVKCICFCGNHSPSSLLSKLVYQDSYNTILYSQIQIFNRFLSKSGEKIYSILSYTSINVL